MIAPPPSGSTAHAPEPVSQGPDFFDDIDIAHPLVQLAADTLRQRNQKENFVDTFIKERGYPVWDAASVFPQEGRPVILVPVNRLLQKTVSGIIYISVIKGQPIFRWIPRGSEIKGEGSPDKKSLEIFMLTFEQKIFGQVQKPGVKVKFEEKTAPALGSNFNMVSGVDYEPVTFEYNCGYVSVDDGETWEARCDTKTIWVRVEDDDDLGGGGSSGSGFGGSGGSSGGGTPSGGSTTSGDTISDYPEVKYPPGSNYAILYPKFTEYLKNQLPTLKDNNTIINAIKEYTSLTTEEIASDLQWGKGPTIKIEPLAGDVYGEFRISTDPNTLFIDSGLVNDLENTTFGSELADAFSFLVGVTILHEYIHYGSPDSNPPGEEGLLFEQDVYGQTVWRDNAKIILKNN